MARDDGDLLSRDQAASPAAVAPPGTPPRIETRGLRRELRSGERTLIVVDDIDLEVAAGECVSIRGPSGAGKSTLLALLAGLDRPTAGSVLIDGLPIEGLSEDELALLRREKIGFVFQSFQLLGNLTARENVQFPLDLLGRRRSRQLAEALLADVGLAERGHHYPSQLSGGEQQRVALARAFAAEPAILLGDEPTGNLDSVTGASVLDVMMALRDRTGSTMVLVTHDPAVAARADRELVMVDGRLGACAVEAQRREL